jgi:hypothetical protein
MNGPIPSELGLLTGLSLLSLENIDLSNVIPSSLGSLVPQISDFFNRRWKAIESSRP